MTYGLKLFNAAGNVTMSTDSRCSRALGSTKTTTSGSVTDAGFATGTPFYFYESLYPYSAASSAVDFFSISFTLYGNTLYWTFSSVPYFPVQIVWGVY